MDFKIKQVRDLAWALQSSELSFFDSYHYLIDFDNEDLDWLKRLDQNPADFLVYLESNQESKRLGKYFELLLNYFFIHSKSIHEVIKGIQIQDDKRTIGELDFLIKPLKNAGWIHLEVAVKFYLAFVINGKTQFIGPNSKDTFSRKKEKLLKKQLEISKLQISKNQLKELGVSIERRAVIMKGFVFINPFLNEQLNLSNLNEYCNKGWWCYLSDFVKWSRSTHFSVLNKLDWLSEFQGIKENVLEKQQVVELISQNKLDLPLMLVEVKEEFPNEFKEVSRGVLVDSDWPKLEL